MADLHNIFFLPQSFPTNGSRDIAQEQSYCVTRYIANYWFTQYNIYPIESSNKLINTL